MPVYYVDYTSQILLITTTVVISPSFTVQVSYRKSFFFRTVNNFVLQDKY